MAAATQTVDLDEDLVRRFVEASWNGGFDGIEDVVTPDYVGYSTDRPEGIHGSEELEEYISAIRAAFPDIELTIGVVATAGDTVWANWKATGTNGGAFMNKAPTGKPTTLMGRTLCRVVDGKVQESKSTIFRSG